MNLEGKILGNRYEMIEKIGNGGMSTVYRAMDKILKRNVAVKILRDEFTTDEEFIKRFEVEAQSAARLTHPNIVSIYDVGVEDNLYYIVMELIQGKTLKEIIIEERGPLPWKWSVNVAIQIASALETAHRNNIIHRDIKPHNIIITEDGIAKVTDFGIAKAVSNSTITAFGTTIGSVHYFSPEHARGGFTDAKSDLYSLGVVMYEMLTGRVPFDADTPVSVALKHMQEEPERPIDVNPNIPVALDKIIMKALQKDSTLRYQSATDMLVDLRKALKDPDGDFVEDIEYDKTARTQKINTDIYENMPKYNNNNRKNETEENKFKKFIKKHKVASSIIGLILLFVLSLGGTLLVLNVTNPPEVDMPNVVGMSRQEAEASIEEAKLKFEVASEEYNKDVPEGHIISQDPIYMERFHKVKEGSTVKVVISKGQEKTTVPNVEGKERQEAIKLIEEAKLKAEVIEEASKTIQKDYVISQETGAGLEAFAGDTVKIHISTGIEKVTVEGVIGKAEAEAKKILQDIGLNVTVTYDEDTTKNNGVVLRQSIEAGNIVDKETAITITVNQVAEMKQGTVKVNLKSILNYTPPAAPSETNSTTNGTTNSTNTTTNQTKVEKATVKIIVGEDKIYEKTVEKTETNISATFNARGKVTIKVYVDDILKGTKEMDMSGTNTVCVFE